MIRLTIVSCFILFLFSSFKPKKKNLIPPGTVKISETFFADETEISNFSWREYECWTKTKYGANSPEHIATLPDTTVWRQPNSNNEPFVKYYYRHPAYKDYPVVGISYEQALSFCKWRTNQVKLFYAIGHKKNLAIEYRLPTKAEWENFSFTHPIVPNFKTGMDHKGRRTINCLSIPSYTLRSSAKGSDNADVTAPVYSYWPNAFKLYNCFGNVSEMVLEKGISKGGSWIHQLEECRAGKDVHYTAPAAWLGFRCVCVVNPS